ncbi:hypothetical protein HNP46_003780 [Pseudomonas nitritireducens]|uniref:Uncharacterized protein n=1 Tax=Pseudomonas nitroreducens TaxID=46680 RepID=A0A7W7P2L3_PSENT|nr:hypothetical protein [Pseudomonas nitritireducens]MBB4864904.1 hypothetical protein [Pseudomonas nitritireducens]
MPDRQSLPNLLRRTALAREAFESRRRITLAQPQFRVQALEAGLYQVIDCASGLERARRRSYAAALDCLAELQRSGAASAC